MIDTAIQELFDSSKATLVLKKDGEIVLTHFGRGIGPALMLLDEQPELLQGAEVYDTIIGKAAASLFILGGAAYVYGETMSVSAAALLDEHGIANSCKIRAPEIINRQGTGLCPFEQAVLHIEAPENCLPVIRSTLQVLRTKAQAEPPN